MKVIGQSLEEVGQIGSDRSIALQQIDDYDRSQKRCIGDPRSHAGLS